MDNFLPHLTGPYQQARLAFKKVLMGISTERNRWVQCVEWTNKKMGMAVGALFIRENFNPDSKVRKKYISSMRVQSFRKELGIGSWEGGGKGKNM